MRKLNIIAALLVIVASTAVAQDIRGTIDFAQSIDEQIKRLERRVGGDP